MEQLAPAASVLPQMFAPVVWMAKSLGLVPVRLGTMLVSSALPVLASVAACAAVVTPVFAVKAAGAVRDATGYCRM